MITLFKSDVRDFLLSFLDENAPQAAFFLDVLWTNQANAVTYDDLREALLSGEINREWFGQWQQDYSNFVTEHLAPGWRNAIREAAERQKESFPGWRFDPASEGINRWTSQRGATFVTNSTDAQIKALRAAVHHIAGTSQNVDELARLVRPMIGLTKPQTIANANYVKKLQEKNLPPKKVADLAAKRAARQHRYRAQMIARTELAFAFNQGTLEWARQAQAEGYLGKAVKVWHAVRDRGKKEDHRCCDVCFNLHGTEVPLEEPFPIDSRISGTDALLAPPAHPMCRCAIDIKEIEPPPEPDFDEINEIESEETELEPLQSEGRYDTIIEIETPTQPQISGAISDPYSTRAEAHAERYYGLVRKMKTDCERIARNTGYSLEEIKRIKSFIFLEKHDLLDGRFDYFDPSFEMAQSWQRLIEGKDIKPHDLTLLKHEMMENRLMHEGLTQDEAHRITSQQYDYRKESDAYYDSLKKY